MLSASSPDDEALVLGAKYFGFEFTERVDGNAVVYTKDVNSPPRRASIPGHALRSSGRYSVTSVGDGYDSVDWSDWRVSEGSRAEKKSSSATSMAVPVSYEVRY